ncbi:MAG: transposase, partial [Gammaproteobacteria bacterium]
IRASRLPTKRATRLRRGQKDHRVALGLLLAVKVTPANVQDREGVRTLLLACYFLYHRLACIWADSGYGGKLVPWVKALRPSGKFHLEIVRRSAEAKGGEDDHSEAMIQLAMIRLMLKRLAST